MTRKDYILIADAMRKAKAHIRISPMKDGSTDLELAGFNAAVSHIMIALESDNPRFDREHFLAVVRGEKDLNSRPSRR